MTIETLRRKIRKINKEYSEDEESSHAQIDQLLLEYINDKIVTKLYKELPKWCA